MTSNLSVLLKKYSVPALFFIAGLSILIVGFTQNQSTMFKLASVLMFLAGALSILLSSGKLNAKLLWVFGGSAGIAAIITFLFSYNGVSDTITYQNNYKKAKALAIQNLSDIKYVQKAYKEENGVYLKTWDEFLAFLKNGTVPFVVADGVVPSRKLQPEENLYLYPDNPPVDNNMTEIEAYRLSKWKEGPYYYQFQYFKRDTVRRSILELKFKNKTYQESREKAGFSKFNPDSLVYVPFTGGREKWVIETKDSVVIGSDTIPTLKVSGVIPFAEQPGKNGDKEPISFGSLSTDDDSGSWENE